MSARKVPPDDELERLYVDERMSSGMIAERCGATRATVCKHLRRLGIVRPASGRNSRNRNFHKQSFRRGYPAEFRPDHPRANNTGYVLEHLLVAEEMLGRVPTKKENVHHINMDKKDNRPENLHVFPDKKSHLRAHWSLNEVAAELIDGGLIVFEDGEYHLNEGAL